MRFALPSLLAGGGGEARSGQRVLLSHRMPRSARTGSPGGVPGALPAPVLSPALPLHARPEDNLCAWGGGVGGI